MTRRTHYPSPNAQESDFVISPRAGVGGSTVDVRLTSLPADTPVLIGFGGVGTPHEILESSTTDAEGALAVTARIPMWVEPNHAYLFYLAFADQRPVAFSDPFLVTDRHGAVTVQGRVTDEGVSCTALRGPNDEFFTLAGPIEGFAPGDTVVVEGTVAEMSMCMQGLTLDVREVRPAR